MIALDNIFFSYNRHPLLTNFNYTFNRGKNTILIGPSGCGKSTVLRLINGLLKQQMGRVLIDDQVVTSDNLITIRRKMGYLIQQGGLFPHMTARQNITLMARRLKWPADRIRQRLQQLSELTHIASAIIDRFPSELSGGQQQRISLMRALMLDPDILLLDEPFAALDPLIKDGLQKNILEIFKKVNKTVVWVTHDLSEAAFVGDIIVLMREGQIIQSGPVEELLKRPANDFVKKFISAQRSHIPGALS